MLFNLFFFFSLDEGGQGFGVFLSEFGIDDMPARAVATAETTEQTILFRLSDTIGNVTFDQVPPPISRSSLSSSDAFLLDTSNSATHPAIYVWIGEKASLNERRLAIQYVQQYLYNRRKENEHAKVTVNIVKMKEGIESTQFLNVLSL